MRVGAENRNVKIFLHIGIDKCGSTSIQAGLYRNRVNLAQAGIFVPDLGLSEAHGHGNLFQDIFGPRSPRHPEGSSTKAKTMAQSLLNELSVQAGKDVNTLVFSWEGLNFLQKKEISSLARMLTGHSVTLIVYIREQAAIAQSGALQNIKVPYHGCRPIDSIRSDPGFLPGINRNYFALLNAWQKYLKPDDMVVRRYDRGSLRCGDAFIDLLSIITPIDPADLGIRPGSEESNSSLDVPSALVLDAVAPHIGRGSQKYYYLADILLRDIERHGYSLKYFLTKSQVENIHAHYLKANQKLATVYLETSDPLFSTKTAPFCTTDQYHEAKSEAANKLRSIVSNIKQLKIDGEKLASEIDKNL